jgi:hypothetical protein
MFLPFAKGKIKTAAAFNRIAFVKDKRLIPLCRECLCTSECAFVSKISITYFLRA